MAGDPFAGNTISWDRLQKVLAEMVRAVNRSGGRVLHSNLFLYWLRSTDKSKSGSAVKRLQETTPASTLGTIPVRHIPSPWHPGAESKYVSSWAAGASYVGARVSRCLVLSIKTKVLSA